VVQTLADRTADNIPIRCKPTALNPIIARVFGNFPGSTAVPGPRRAARPPESGLCRASRHRIPGSPG